MAPPNIAHSAFQFRTTKLIDAARPPASTMLIKATVRLNDRTIRLLDAALTDADLDRSKVLLPNQILLALEVADSTLARDLGDKLEGYARAGIGNYWVVDLRARVVHVFSEPAGADFGVREVVRFGETLLIPGSDRPITID